MPELIEEVQRYPVLITYDLHNDNESQVKDGLLLRGYSAEITGIDDEGQRGTCSLPYSTLYKARTNKRRALLDIRNVIRDINRDLGDEAKIVLERVIVVPCSSWRAFDYER